MALSCSLQSSLSPELTFFPYQSCSDHMTIMKMLVFVFCLFYPISAYRMILFDLFSPCVFALLLKMPMKALNSIVFLCMLSLLIQQLDQRNLYSVLVKYALFFLINLCSLSTTKACMIYSKASTRINVFQYKMKSEKLLKEM